MRQERDFTNVLEANGAWCIIKVHTADLQRV